MDGAGWAQGSSVSQAEVRASGDGAYLGAAGNARVVQEGEII